MAEEPTTQEFTESPAEQAAATQPAGDGDLPLEEGEAN
jgi:hypothetical protein